MSRAAPRSVAGAARYPRLLALLAGAVAATGFQPLALWPVGLAGVALLAWLVAESGSAKEAALRGWLFGLSHFTLGLNWIATAFTFQAQMPAALGWLAVPLLSVYLAVYPAFAAWAARRVGGAGRSAGFVAIFAAAWIVSEWLRSFVFTGFAWNPLSSMLLGGFARPGIAAALPWMGTYALSGIAVLIAGTAWLLLAERRFVPLGFLAALLTAGMFAPAGPARQEGTQAFTIVQPYFPQEMLDRPELYDENFARLAQLGAPRDDSPRILMWPESGFPDFIEDGYPARYYRGTTYGNDPAVSRARLGQAIGENTVLLLGGTHLFIEDDALVGASNSVTAVRGGDGAMLARYDKAQLVPYGEYLALRWLLEPLGATRLVAGTVDFLPGDGPATFDLPGMADPALQICYEIIFSGRLIDRAQRPDFIFSPSNDGWFGSWGPPQFFAQGRMRAIEEGLPLLRSTTTGISGVIDTRGVVVSHLPHGEAGRIDGLIPRAAPPTLFARLGNGLALGWALLLLVAGLVAKRRARG